MPGPAGSRTAPMTPSARTKPWVGSPAPHRVAAADDLVLAEAERLTRGDAELRLDQIHSRHHLCHGVLDLQAGVDLDAVKGITVEQELHGAGVDVAHGAGRSHRGRSQALPQVRSERR